MKKVFAILLTFLLFFSICSCSANSNSDNPKNFFAESPNQTESVSKAQLGEGTKEDSVLILAVKINPKMELYINDQGNISAVLCKNKDAQQLFASLNVLDLHFKEGIIAILAEAQAQGYLKKDDNIDLNPVVQNGLDWSEELAHDLVEPVFLFSHMRDLNLTTTSSPPKVQDTDGSFISFPEAPKISNSNIIYTKTEKHPDGSKIEFTFNSVGNIIQEVYYNTDGTVSTFSYENGEVVHQYDQHTDGSSSDITYKNGQCATHIRTSPNGDKETTTYIYHPNGETAKIVSDSSAGTHSETIFDENGVMTGGSHIEADGTGYQYTYNPDGSLASHTPIGTGIEQLITYHENGQVATVTIKDGAYSSVRTYDDAGNMVHESEIREDGIATETAYTYFSNGQVASSTTDHSDGYHGEITYYESGKLSSSKTRSEQGWYSEEVYNMDGSLASQISDMGDGIVVTSHFTYHANGQIASEITDNSSGNHIEQTFFENGKVATYHSTNADGSYSISRYNAAGIEIYHEQENEFGYSKTICRDDGTREFMCGKGDGYRYEAYFHKNDKQRSREDWFSDGSHVKETYNEDGKILTWESTDTAGWHTIRTYNSDGTSEQLTTRNDGSILKVIYDAAGNVVSTEDSNKNWQSYE